MIPVKRLVIEIENSLRISLTRNQRDPASNFPVGKSPGLAGIIKRGKAFEGMTAVGDRLLALTPINAILSENPDECRHVTRASPPLQ